MILTLIVTFIGVSIIIFSESSGHIAELTESFSEFHIREQKQLLQNEVDSRYDEIAHESVRLQSDYNELVKNKIQSLANALRTQPFAVEAPCGDQQACFLNTFEQYVSHDDYLYFVLTPEGVLLRSGTDNRVEGVDLMDHVDKDGVYYAREMLEAVDNSEGVYVTYHWPKVKGGEPLKKTSYCFYMEEYDLIIGTGAYEEDITNDLKDRIFARLQSYYEGREKYIFINDYDGITHVHSRPSAIGFDFSTIVDDNGLNVHDAFMDAIAEDGSSYVSYYVKDRASEDAGDKQTKKIAYIRRVDEWGVYIGMGYHTNNLVAATEEFISDFNRNQTISMIITIGTLFMAGIVVLYLVRRGSVMQSNYMKKEDIIHEQLLNKANDLVIVLNDAGKMVFINRPLPDDVDLDACIKGNELVMDAVKDDIHAIYGSENVYYVELKSEKFYYRGEPATIYFIKDITKQYEAANTMEELALHDDLTGLPNRRRFKKDMYEYCESDCDSCNQVLAMIDIDQFKVINDTYGHDFVIRY